MKLRNIPIATLVLIAGCACNPEQVPVPMPVEVEVVRYVPVPAELLRECPAAPALRDGMTGGELLEAARAWQDRAECQARQLGSIGRLR